MNDNEKKKKTKWEKGKMEMNQLYERLNILDNKCSALLQLSSVILALTIISATFGKLTGLAVTLSLSIAVLFLITSLLSLFVIWIRWTPTKATVDHRTCMYRIAVILTAIGLICMASLIITSIGVLG